VKSVVDSAKCVQVRGFCSLQIKTQNLLDVPKKSWQAVAGFVVRTDDASGTPQRNWRTVLLNAHGAQKMYSLCGIYPPGGNAVAESVRSTHPKADC
jgi:hypothetical protein